MRLKSVFAIALVVIAYALSLTAQTASGGQLRPHHHYKLIDVGTFGGPGGGIVYPSSRILNSSGEVIGASDTGIPDPFAPNCFLDCYVLNGWIWQDGVRTNLGTLPGGASSVPSAINAYGVIVGQAQNGTVDSLTGWPETDAVLWEHGQVRNLGNLGGTQGIANAINNGGLVVGAALTTTADPFANSPLTGCFYLPTTGFNCTSLPLNANAVFYPGTTESHAFLWQRGQMRDLGTLGGPDSAAWIINDRGQVAGFSFTSFNANPSTGVPTVDPFLWDPTDGRMKDLGGLGGTSGAPQWMNNLGEVVGSSNLPGDTVNHPFLWSKGVMTDLGTTGGNFGVAFSINDAGEVVGTIQDVAPLTNIHAFLWKGGTITNLGTVDGDPCSQAFRLALTRIARS